MYNDYQYYDNLEEGADRCDICGSSIYNGSGIMENDLCLCSECSNKMMLIDDGIIKDSIMKFAIGNVF